MRFKGNPRGAFFWHFYKIAHLFTKNRFLQIIGFPIRILYNIIINWILGIDISEFTEIGEGLVVWHGMGLVVHPQTKIGRNVVLRHNTTIGNAKPGCGAPTICDNVQIGANSVIIGNITIGENSIVGAGSVVLKNVPSNVVVAGNPAAIIKKNN